MSQNRVDIMEQTVRMGTSNNGKGKITGENNIIKSDQTGFFEFGTAQDSGVQMPQAYVRKPREKWTGEDEQESCRDSRGRLASLCPFQFQRKTRGATENKTPNN